MIDVYTAVLASQLARESHYDVGIAQTLTDVQGRRGNCLREDIGFDLLACLECFASQLVNKQSRRGCDDVPSAIFSPHLTLIAVRFGLEEPKELIHIFYDSP